MICLRLPRPCHNLAQVLVREFGSCLDRCELLSFRPRQQSALSVDAWLPNQSRQKIKTTLRKQCAASAISPYHSAQSICCNIDCMLPLPPTSISTPIATATAKARCRHRQHGFYMIDASTSYLALILPCVLLDQVPLYL